MSKSDPSEYSRIDLSDDSDLLLAKIRRSLTDTTPTITYDWDGRPGVSNLVRKICSILFIFFSFFRSHFTLLSRIFRLKKSFKTALDSIHWISKTSFTKLLKKPLHQSENVTMNFAGTNHMYGQYSTTVPKEHGKSQNKI